mmetsp:Transcript_11570/g.25717  ORF Transcript_11570/g.25717 Transcript_11570/m.25717 type:complete len:235 (-) Transcript_11570:786-1490(-)
MSEAWRLSGEISGPRRPGGMQSVSVVSMPDAMIYRITLDQINVSVIGSQQGVFLLQPSDPRCVQLASGRGSMRDELDLVGEWNIDSLMHNVSMGSPGRRPAVVLTGAGDGVEKLQAVHWIRDLLPASTGGFVSASFSAAEATHWEDHTATVPAECTTSDHGDRVVESSYSFVAALTALMQHTDGEKAPVDQQQWSFNISTIGHGSSGQTHGDSFGRASWVLAWPSRYFPSLPSS